MSEKDEFRVQLDRVCASDVLHGSESLCRLLRYLAQKEFDSPGVHIKEYQIATEVYGRPADFDPQFDSTIRVQAARLRAKLTDYYADQGAHDSIVIDLPKGSYSVHFRRRTNGHGAHSAIEAAVADAVVPRRSRRWPIAAPLLLFLALISWIATAELWRERRTVQASVPGSELAPAAFRVFWQPFLHGPEAPWVIFSNGAFVGRPESGMRYYDPKRDSKAQVRDHYTGVGEVLAIHNLDEVFNSLRRSLRVKRGSLFSLDDANNNDLIFVGSPSENLKLSDLPSTREFIFQRMEKGPRKGDLAIVNVHPQPNEPEAFLASPSGAPLTEDYAIVAFMPGLNPARSLMVLAGTTTFGTEAAVEFVSRQSSVEDLLAKLSATNPGDVKPFEAVVRVKIALGVPVGMDLVTVRKRS
jgi:hypothetical protein